MDKSQRNKLIGVMVLFILIIFGVLILLFDPFLWFIETDKDLDDEVVDIVEPTDEDKELMETLWNENSAINKDYVGTIKFESGIIDLPFVQGSDNNTYFHTDWKTMEYDREGTVFLDSNNTLDDQNLILIGHYVYESFDESRTHKFTPLAKLIDEENYEDNKKVKLYLENEIREYEVAYVYYCQLIYETSDEESFYYTEDGFEFYIPNYTETMFNSYIGNVKKNALYDTGVDINYNDKLLTLQTCVEYRSDEREIVLLKEVKRKEYR